MSKDSEITNKNLMEENNSIDTLEGFVIQTLLKNKHVVIPAFGYLEVKSLSNKRTILYKTANAEHPVVKDFSHGADAGYIPTLYNYISASLKEGKKVSLPKLGTFTPIKNNEDGTYRISFTPSVYFKDLLNGKPQKVVEDLKPIIVEKIKDNNTGESNKIKNKEEKIIPVDSGKKPEENSISDIFKENKIVAEIKSTKETKSRSENQKRQPEKVVKKRSQVGDTVVPQEKKVTTGKKKAFPKWIGILIAIILVLCIIGTIFYENKGNKGNEENEEKTVSIITNKNESINLLTLAEKHYGNQVFWVYIYDANQEKIKSPINVPQGIDLIVPDLTEYNINTQDSIEIYLAKIKGDLILEKNRIINKN